MPIELKEKKVDWSYETWKRFSKLDIGQSI